jgi:hypothetical protein
LADIFVVTVTYGPRATQDSLFFKTLAAAQTAEGQFCEGALASPDDFGSSLSVFGELQSVRLSHMAKSLDVQIEQSIWHARAQAQTQRLAAADPVLKLGGGLPVAHGSILPFPGR